MSRNEIEPNKRKQAKWERDREWWRGRGRVENAKMLRQCCHTIAVLCVVGVTVFGDVVWRSMDQSCYSILFFFFILFGLLLLANIIFCSWCCDCENQEHAKASHTQYSGTQFQKYVSKNEDKQNCRTGSHCVHGDASNGWMKWKRGDGRAG